MLTTLAILALLFGQADAAVLCAGETFFGEDRNPDDTQNNVLPLASTPNADAARDLFFMGLAAPSTEDLESLGAGDTSPELVFPGSTITAMLTGGETRQDPPINGQYAISPTTYFSTDEDFSIAFSTNITAFGFYGVDIGDVQGILSLTAERADGTSCMVNIPHEVDGPSGGVLYFAYIDLAEPFYKVIFTNSEGKRDRFAFDDFTIATRGGTTFTGAPSDAPTPFELCVDGITNADETVCCDGGCGVCGGCDCDLNPGGAPLCCPGVIAATEFVCMMASDVACLLGDYIPVEETECTL